MVSAVVVALSYHKEKMRKIFKDKLTAGEINIINCRRQAKTQIKDGKLSDNEIKYI